MYSAVTPSVGQSVRKRARLALGYFCDLDPRLPPGALMLGSELPSAFEMFFSEPSYIASDPSRYNLQYLGSSFTEINKCLLLQ